MLPQQREAFAQAIAAGKSQADAYRIAYPTSENWKDSSIYCEASKLMSNTYVLQRVEQLRAELAEKQLWKREDSVRELRAVIADGGSVAVSAVKELNAMHGYNAPQKVEHSGPGGGVIPHAMFVQIVGFDELDDKNCDPK